MQLLIMQLSPTTKILKSKDDKILDASSYSAKIKETSYR
jgi:hypothetical protein